MRTLRIDDVTGKGSDIKLNLLYSHNPEIIDNFLLIRKEYTSEHLIKSDALFVTKIGNAYEQINVDFNVLRRKCHINENVTLSSIRNACITEFCTILKNEELIAALFDVTVGRICKMREGNLLVTLPCEVGTTVYLMNDACSIESGVIERFQIGRSGVPLAEISIGNDSCFSECRYGKDFFLSYKEAERNLAKHNQ